MTEENTNVDTTQEPAEVTTPTPSAEADQSVDTTLLSDAGVEKKEEAEVPKEDGQEEKKEDAPKEEKASDVVPDNYEFKIPEGMEMDTATLELFSPIFKELGLTTEKAQKLVDPYVTLIQSQADKTRSDSLNEFKQIVDGWKAETMESLGADADQKLALCARAINKFGSPELRTALKETGVGNHKEFVSFMMKVGETVTEDTLVDPETPRLPGSGSVDPRKLYPTMKQ